jgi:Conjugal transfer protein TrbH
MKAIHSLLIALVLLQGCVTSPYGNFAADQLNGAMLDVMVQDSVRKLTALYPPAQNRLNIKQPLKDGYGLALVRVLRKNGYAIVEDIESAASSTKQPVKYNGGGRDLNYILDRVDNGVYRLSLLIDKKVMSRAYLNGTSPYAIGAWSISG